MPWNILQKRIIAITSYRNTQSTRSLTADWSKARGLSTSQQDKLTPGANGCNWTEAHGVIAPSAQALILHQKYYRLCSVQSCSLLLTNWWGNSSLIGFWTCLPYVWITESGPSININRFLNPANHRAHLNCFNIQYHFKKVYQRQQTGDH